MFVVGTIISGSCNSILTKLQDMQCVFKCGTPQAEYFDQPVVQTLQMFLGEMLCWIPLWVLRYMAPSGVKLDEEDETVDETRPVKKDIRTWKESTILALPALCDVLATTMMNIGLLYTPVSIYQMTRGSLILIVGLMSVIFLQRRITKLEWISLFVVTFGVGLVGLSGYLAQEHVSRASEGLDVLFGMFLIFLGITLSASQFVIEEYLLSSYDVQPIRLVGFEGIYGFLITFGGMITGHLLGLFDLVRAWEDTVTNKVVLYTSFGIMLSISSFNYFGVSLTVHLNATARSTIDTLRTLLVWVFSLAIGWEKFNLLQFGAFALLVIGTFSYNGVIQPENWDIVPEWLKEMEDREQF